MRLLFVCLGNICRSPTAEGVMRAVLHEHGLERAITVDSAGTAGWHVGGSPDPRSVAEAARHGVRVDGVARQAVAADFERYDLLLAMDAENRAGLRRLAPGARARDRVHLLREFDPVAVAADDLDVPDPYYGGPGGFAEVFDIVDRACRGLLEAVRPHLPG